MRLAIRLATAALLVLPAVAFPAETLLTASRIHTMNPARPLAQAMVYDAAGRILALDDAAALAARYPAATRVDVGTATVVPGLIDAHGHVQSLGLTRMRADLAGVRSKAEVLQRLRAFAADLPPGAWLTGRGWDQNLWPERAFPTAADLDAAFPDRPVWLRRVDGHAAWANSAAMRLATRPLDGDWQPDGGHIERAGGQATGVFVDAAMALIDAAAPDLDEATATRALELGMREALAHGLTGVHDAGVSLSQLRLYQRLADAGNLPIRISAMADGDGQALDWLCSDGLYQHPGRRLRMRAVKLFADGALGSRGAALIEPYSDADTRGLMLTSPEDLRRITAKAVRCNVQAATHAIGDAGNHEVLEAYAQALATAGGERRWRIEHAQIMALDDIPRFRTLGIIASMQPTHATSDMGWAQDRVGPQRIQGAYAWRKFRDAGVQLALGSDFPVESVDPRLGLYAATTRTDGDGLPVGGWMPQEKLTAFEALRGFTIDAARAGFAEDEVGSLEPGKRADFVVLAEDPLAVPDATLRNLTVLSTWVDGKAEYRRP